MGIWGEDAEGLRGGGGMTVLVAADGRRRGRGA